MTELELLRAELDQLLASWRQRIKQSQATPESEVDAYHQGMQVCHTELAFVLEGK